MNNVCPLELLELSTAVADHKVESHPCSYLAMGGMAG